MKFKVQVIIEHDDAAADVIRDVFCFERDKLDPGNIGLALAEAGGLLAAMQEAVVSEQVAHALAGQAPCPRCSRPHCHKDTRQIVLRTLFGKLNVRSPRWYHCPCRPAPTRSFTPLPELLPERATPELLYLESKFVGLVPYGAAAKLLQEVLPLGRRLHATAVRRHAQAVAERLDGELDKEQRSFIECCPRERAKLPRPGLWAEAPCARTATCRSR